MSDRQVLVLLNDYRHVAQFLPPRQGRDSGNRTHMLRGSQGERQARTTLLAFDYDEFMTGYSLRVYGTA